MSFWQACRGIKTVIFLYFLFAASTCFAQSASTATRELKSFLRSYVEQKHGDPSLTTYSFAVVELNGGKEKQALVYLSNRDWCGSGGCTLLVLEQNNGSFRKISGMTISNLPIRVLDTTSNGWHDIGVRVKGGVDPGHEARMRYDGKKYPLNPSLAPKASPHALGKTAIAENARTIPLVKP